MLRLCSASTLNLSNGLNFLPACNALPLVAGRLYTIIVTLDHFKKHLLPHKHEDDSHHQAHALSPFAFFTYIQILIIVIAGLYLIRIKAPHILGTASFSAEQIIDLTNAKREKNNQPALIQNSLLTKAAQNKVQDMFANNYWAHTSQKGRTPWSFITNAGYRYLYAGENLARDFHNASSVVDAWMNSPSHRANLLDSNFKEIGVAVASGDFDGRESILVVQEFGTGISQIPTEEPLVNAQPLIPQPDNGQIAPAPQPVIAQDTSLQSINSEVTVLASRKYAIAKIVSLFMVSGIFLLFTVEFAVVLRKKHLKLRSGLLAHIMLLGFVLFAVWYAAAGAVL